MMDKKNIVRWILDVLLMVAVVYGGWSIRIINKLEKNDIRQEARLEAMSTTILSVSEDVSSIVETLKQMVFEQAVENRITQLKMRDRWTAAMQEDLQNEWFDLISGIHPEVGHRDLPSIRDIQARYPEGQATNLQ